MLNLKTSSADASITIKELKNIISSINYDESVASLLLSDSISAVKTTSIINNLDKSSNEINTVINNLNDFILNLKNGEGTLNYMVNDTILVKNIDKTIKNIKEGSIRLNENLEALKHNFLFRRYFKKLERQKEKDAKNKN
jgi:phospholipid/cholesterol/gamma-HCH transport system substrate-binding protein